MCNSAGNVGDSQHIVRDVFAGLAIPARRRSRQLALPINEAYRKAVKLRLGRVFNVLQFKSFCRAPVEVVKLLRIKGVGQRKHGQGVLDWLKRIRAFTTDIFGRAVAAFKFRIGLLKRLQFAKQAIVLGIRNSWSVV